MRPEHDLPAFIHATFGSVWTLEVLLLLAQDGDRRWSEVELIGSLRASALIISNAVADLAAAGLVVIESEDSVYYGPASADLGELVAKTRELYATAPDKLRRMIIRSRASGIAAFADAFRIRKD